SLVSIRNISPLNTLRMNFGHTAQKEPLRWLVYGLIFLFIFVFSYFQIGSLLQTAVFTVGLLFAFLALSGLAYGLIWLIRKFFPAGWPYLWRQGFSNLFRPNNQTLILIVT